MIETFDEFQHEQDMANLIISCDALDSLERLYATGTEHGVDKALEALVYKDLQVICDATGGTYDHNSLNVSNESFKVILKTAYDLVKNLIGKIIFAIKYFFSSMGKLQEQLRSQYEQLRQLDMSNYRGWAKVSQVPVEGLHSRLYTTTVEGLRTAYNKTDKLVSLIRNETTIKIARGTRIGIAILDMTRSLGMSVVMTGGSTRIKSMEVLAEHKTQSIAKHGFTPELILSGAETMTEAIDKLQLIRNLADTLWDEVKSDPKEAKRTATGISALSQLVAGTLKIAKVMAVQQSRMGNAMLKYA